MSPARLRALQVVVWLMRALDGVSRRLTDPDAGRCPVTGHKHVFGMFLNDPAPRLPRCAHCSQPKQSA